MKRDNAVSPVIGTILLVAVTVIITAVITAFVLGMAGDIQQTRIIAITSDAIATSDGTARIISLTNHGGKDVYTLVPPNLTVIATAGATPVCVGQFTQAGGLSATIGSSGTCTTTNLDTVHLVVVGHFADSTSQILLDTYQ